MAVKYPLNKHKKGMMELGTELLKYVFDDVQINEDKRGQQRTVKQNMMRKRELSWRLRMPIVTSIWITY